MELRFSVSGMAEVRRALEAAPKQARFAAARALTDTVQEVRAAVLADLPSEFTIRTGWVAKGIRIVRANPSSLEAVIGSKDDFMEVQATGGEREDPGAVPIEARKTKSSLTRPSQWAGKLKKGFLAPLSTGGLYMGVERKRRDGSLKIRRSTSVHAPSGRKRGKYPNPNRSSYAMAVWERFGPKVKASRGRYKGQKRQAIRLMYVLPDTVEIKTPRFRLRQIAEQIAAARFLPHFQRRFAEALETAR